VPTRRLAKADHFRAALTHRQWQTGICKKIRPRSAASTSFSVAASYLRSRLFVLAVFGHKRRPLNHQDLVMTSHRLTLKLLGMNLTINGSAVDVDDRHAKTPLLWVRATCSGCTARNSAAESAIAQPAPFCSMERIRSRARPR